MTEQKQKKRTQVEVLTKILENADLTAEQREVLEKIVSNIKKKNSHKSATKNKEHEKLEEELLNIISAEPNRIFTCGELAKALNSSTQKLTPRLAALVEENKIVKTVEKRVNHYQLAKAE